MNSLYSDKPLRRDSTQFPRFILKFLQYLLVAICIVLFVLLFLVSPINVGDNSMSPLLKRNQTLLINKTINWLNNTELGSILGYTYSVGDIISFQKPGGFFSIKRIIAKEGDRVAIRDGFIFINNVRHKEEYLLPSTFTDGGNLLEDGGESLIIPENEYFVLGDKRDESLDSRYTEIGLIKEEWLLGKIFMVIWPMSDFKIINSK